MTSLTGTLALIRLILRRDRIRIVVWVGSIVVLAALTVAGIKGLFPTEAAPVSYTHLTLPTNREV